MVTVQRGMSAPRLLYEGEHGPMAPLAHSLQSLLALLAQLPTRTFGTLVAEFSTASPAM